MSRRALLGIAVVLAWGVGLAAFTHRERSRTTADRLAESALRVAPGATYFAVLREGRHVGYASTTIDTLPARILVTEFFVVDAMLRDSLRRETYRARVRLDRSLVLHDFFVQHTTDSAPRIVRGRILQDTLLEVVVRTGSDWRASTTTHRVVREPPTALPIVATVAMLAGSARVGRTLSVAALDPKSGESQQTSVRLAAESLFVVPDSAAFDGEAGRWRGVHNDSVRAWRLEGVSGTLWVDAAGRVVRHERADGTTLQRTAYELAFENWRSKSPLRNRAPIAKPNTHD